MGWFSALTDFDKQFHFYKHYHTNSTNKRIHTVGIPMLIVTGLMLLSLLRLPEPIHDASILVVLVYMLYYVILRAELALVFAPFLLVLYAVSKFLCRRAGPHGIVPWALAFHFIAWFVQFVGHYAFEGNSPALMDSFVASILVAPLVIWLEALFSFGLLLDLKARLMRSRVVAKARKAVEASAREAESTAH